MDEKKPEMWGMVYIIKDEGPDFMDPYNGLIKKEPKKIVETLMPLSINESIQEWTDMKEDSEKEKQPNGPSLSQRLRDALRTDTGGIGNLIEEAIRQLNGFYLLTEKMNVALQKESEHLNDLVTILMKVH